MPESSASFSQSSSSLPSSPVPAFPRSAFSQSAPAVVAALRAAGCVFAEEEADLLLAAAATPDELAVLVERRVAGLPLEHVLGWAEFKGRRIAVGPGVFVPRRRTEFLVERALALVPDARVVVDLCCGSGAVGAVLTAELRDAGRGLGDVELHAADIDPAAVRHARRNLAPYGGHVHQGDLYDALPDSLRGRVGILAANVPYVPTADIGLLPPEARDHEPTAALDGGADGLDVLRRVAARAVEWLAPGGCLFAETGEHQLATAVEIFRRAGLDPSSAVSEEYEAQVVAGRRP